MTTVREIAAAIADELQLSDTERVSVSQVTVSITYKIDSHDDDDDWMDEWYKEFQQRSVEPF